METQSSQTVDYRAQAIKALERIERESSVLDAIPERIKTCREAWRDYGAALLAQRQHMPSNKEFGVWIESNGLDQGRATSHGARADAMWLAENWANVHGMYNGNQHHPTNIRQECRDAGYEWAGETQHQKERKAKSRRAKKAKPKAAPTDVNWIHGLEQAWDGPLPVGWRSDMLAHKARGGKRAQLEAEYGKPIPARIPVSEAPAIAAALRRLIDAQEIERGSDADEKLRDIRAGLKEPLQKKFDRAVERAVKLRRAELEREFDARLEAEVAKRLPQEAKEQIERERRKTERAEESERIWRGRMQSTRTGVTLLMDNWRSLAACFHPDRIDNVEERREKFTEASRLLNNIREALKFVNYKSWGGNE